ncbi:MAG: ribosome recycling factor [Acidobacteriota bacterium]|nr:MAG: ribosome recycling factor [Acidobacteriota bacterium]
MLDELYKRTRTRMDQSVEAVKRELNALRTGRASTTLLDGISVDYYGQMTPLNQVAKLSAPEPGLLVAQPFDPTLVPVIEKAIRSSDLGLNPASDGKVIRIPIPPLTEERRRQLVKKVGTIAEEGRTAVRQIRRDANEEIKAAQKEGEISEDDGRRGLEEIQKLTDEHVKRIDELAKAKEKELMEF